MQRQSAIALAEGGLGRLVSDWEQRLLRESALIEAVLDFSDEGDVGDVGHDALALAGQGARTAISRVSPRRTVSRSARTSRRAMGWLRQLESAWRRLGHT